MVSSFQLMEKVSNGSSEKLQGGAIFVLQLVRPNGLFQRVQIGMFMLGMVLVRTQTRGIAPSYVEPDRSLKGPKGKMAANFSMRLLRHRDS